MDHCYARKPFSEKNGVKIFTHSDFYWGIISRKEMDAFNTAARERGFSDTLKNFSFKSRFDYAEHYRRADFHFLLPIDTDATILDIGSGFGNVTIPLAKYHKKVYAVDASRPLLEFSRLRAESAGVHNIEYAHVDPLENCNLPFKPKTFDAIILNGVLEWVGAAVTNESPEIIQERFLAHVRTLLKDGGVLYVGIENRLFPGWLKRDPHSKLPWTVLLPRGLADMYARKHGLSGYRTYIYSRFGYGRLFDRAGFRVLDTYSPHTSYREPDYIYNADKGVASFMRTTYAEKMYTRKWSFLVRYGWCFGIDRLFLSSFMFLLGVEGKRTSPFLIRLAGQKVPGVHDSDSLMKVRSDDPDYARFLLFHKGDREPYLDISVPRDGDYPDRWRLRKLMLDAKR